MVSERSTATLFSRAPTVRGAAVADFKSLRSTNSCAALLITEQEGFRPAALNPNPSIRKVNIRPHLCKFSCSSAHLFKCSVGQRPSGAGGIRTPVPITRETVFKTVALNRSATAPDYEINRLFYIHRLKENGLSGIHTTLQPKPCFCKVFRHNFRPPESANYSLADRGQDGRIYKNLM